MASGSDTAARQALTQAEKAGAIPYVGKALAGAAKLGGKIMDLGEDARQNRLMKTTQLDDAATAAVKQNKGAARSGNTLRSIKAAAGVAHRATLNKAEREKAKAKDKEKADAYRDSKQLEVAKYWLAKQTSLDWDELSQRSRDKILEAAKHGSQALARLDRYALERRSPR